MFDWAKLALLILQLAYSIVSWLKDQKLINEGYDKAIGEQALLIAGKTEHAKKIMEAVNSLSSADVDQRLHDLEPK